MFGDAALESEGFLRSIGSVESDMESVAGFLLVFLVLFEFGDLGGVCEGEAVALDIMKLAGHIGALWKGLGSSEVVFWVVGAGVVFLMIFSSFGGFWSVVSFFGLILR